ncbi:MAG: hypothetical protein U0893_21845 [Chloroflexota bacterium]
MSVQWLPSSNESLGLLCAESHVLTALAGGMVLRGTPDELMYQLGVSPHIFRVALHDLIVGGWIFAMTTRDGQLTIGRERRARNDGPPAAVERRQSSAQLPESFWESHHSLLGI